MKTKRSFPRLNRRRPAGFRFPTSDLRLPTSCHRGGFTLVEIMIATVLTLMLMALVVQIFAMVGNATAETRSMLEVNERLRNCKTTLQNDLRNVTARMLPPLKVSDQAGYFEYVEGPMGLLPNLAIQPVDSALNVPDTTVGDTDDVLMFTTRNQEQPFYGRFRAIVNMSTPTTTAFQFVDTVTTSQYAEVSYFVRAGTLYRRVLLVLGHQVNMGVDPQVKLTGQISPAALSSTYDAGAAYSLPLGSPPTPPFTYLFDHSVYDKYDVSLRQVGGTFDKSAGASPMPMLMCNSLGDLTRRENRYGHQPHAYPYDTRFWGPLGLPTLRECTFYTNVFPPPGVAPVAHWPFPFYEPNPNPAPPPAGMNIAASEAGSLWAVLSPTPALGNVANGPYIYPFPAAVPAYQSYYQNATIPADGYANANLLPPAATPSTVPAAPGGNPQFLYLTQNGKVVATQDFWQNRPLPPTYAWDQVSPFNGAIAAFSLSVDETDTVVPGQYDTSTRVSDDVILTNVLSFDVKAWDPEAPILFGTINNPNAPAGHSPTNYYDASSATVFMPGDGDNVVTINVANYRLKGANYLAAVQSLGSTTSIVGRGAYVDLGYLQLLQYGLAPPPVTPPPPAPAPLLANAVAGVNSVFSSPGAQNSMLKYVYDTGCFNYEEDGIDNNGNGIVDEFTNGIDDNLINGVDDVTEMEGPVPYPAPLKGIQIKIRVFEPDSRQIREITVVEDFLWE